MNFTMIACYQAYNSTATEHALDDVICIAVSISGRSKALLQSMPQHCYRAGCNVSVLLVLRAYM